MHPTTGEQLALLAQHRLIDLRAPGRMADRV